MLFGIKLNIRTCSRIDDGINYDGKHRRVGADEGGRGREFKMSSKWALWQLNPRCFSNAQPLRTVRIRLPNVDLREAYIICQNTDILHMNTKPLSYTYIVQYYAIPGLRVMVAKRNANRFYHTASLAMLRRVTTMEKIKIKRAIKNINWIYREVPWTCKICNPYVWYILRVRFPLIIDIIIIIIMVGASNSRTYRVSWWRRPGKFQLCNVGRNWHIEVHRVRVYYPISYVEQLRLRTCGE